MQPGHPMMMGGPPQQIGTPMGMSHQGNSDAAVNKEFLQIPQNSFNLLKDELGFGDKNITTLNMAEKVSRW
jgi:hypothetical protein